MIEKMGFLHYILFFSAPIWFKVIAAIVMVVAVIIGISMAKEDRAPIMVLFIPFVAWVALIIWFLVYDKLHIIYIPF